MPDTFIGRPHDFDFLAGRWTIANRRLKQRHVGSDDWDEFPATSQAWVHLDGLLSIDGWEIPSDMMDEVRYSSDHLGPEIQAAYARVAAHHAR